MSRVRLGDILLDIESGRSFQTSDVPARPDELGVLKVSAVTWSAFRPDEAKAVLNYWPDERHRVKSGDLLISRANTQELVGAVVLISNDYPHRLLSDKTLRLVVDTERADKRYLLYALRSAQVRQHIEAHATGTSSSMRNIGQDTIREIPLRLPRLPEQRETGVRLENQFTAVQDLREQISALELETRSLRLSIYRQAFREIVPTALSPGIEVPPPGWRWTKLGDVARLESGHTPSRSRPDWWGGDVSWISLTEIRALDGRWVDETRIKTNEAGLANSAARILPRGTVCFSRTASVGFVTIMGKPMATSQDFANWVCGDELDPEFLMHALIRSRAELRALATGATHKTIYMPALGSFHVCMPKKDEQVRIVQRMKVQIAVAAEMQAAAKAQLDETERLPARLLAQAFDTL